MLCGDYYLPGIGLLTDIEPTYGKYGMLRKSYLQEHRRQNIKYCCYKENLSSI